MKNYIVKKYDSEMNVIDTFTFSDVDLARKKVRDLKIAGYKAIMTAKEVEWLEQ